MQLTSRTIFFFAFQWKTEAGFPAVLEAARAGGWRVPQPFSTQIFSQKNFLHDFARSAVFESAGTPPTVFNFEKKLNQPFQIEIRNKGIGRTPDDATSTFRPTATFATLDIYEAGVGILSLTLDCPEGTATPADLLAINDLGRRLYPQTLGQKGLAAAHNSGLIPVRVGFENDLEDFSAFAKADTLPQKFLPKYLLDLFGSRFKILPEQVSAGDVLIENTFDDRLFVLSCLADEAVSKNAPDFLDDPFWYKFVFVDGGSISIKNQEMQRQLIAVATYPRWSEDGTVFGASRYSFVAVAKHGWLFGVMSGNYLQLVKLCLVQRAAVLRFREEATAISSSIAGGGDASKIAEKIRLLHGDFIRFSNRLNFREVTSYEQGIELYDLIRRQMRVGEQVAALKEELAELAEFAAQSHENARSRSLDQLSFLGAAFLVPTLLLAYFGFFEKIKTAHSLIFWFVLSGVAVAALVFFGGWLRRGGGWLVLGCCFFICSSGWGCRCLSEGKPFLGRIATIFQSLSPLFGSRKASHF